MIRYRNIRAAIALAVMAAAAGCGTVGNGSAGKSAAEGPKQVGGPTGPTREILPNGLTLIVQDHRAADITAVHLWVGVGVRDEAANALGASHFQEHMLFKGTDRWGPGYIDRTVEGIGGRSNAVTSFDYTNFYVLVPSDALEEGVQLLSEMAFSSIFDPKEIDNEREVIFEESRSETDNPRTAIVRQLYGLVFDGHPYGRPVLGTRPTMTAATRQSLMAYYHHHYTPENMALVVVGPNNPDEVRATVTKHWGGVKPTGYHRDPIPAPRPVAGQVSRKVERPEQQAMLGFGWQAPRSDNPESFAIDLLVSILGGTESSRLVQRLRDTERLVSGLKMSYAALVAGGIVTLRAELEVGDMEKVDGIILEEIARLQAEGVTEEERRLAVTKAESEHAFDTETSEGLAGAYGLAQTTWELEEELRYLDRLRSVTREQIQEAARRYLSRENFARLAFVPKGGQK